MDRIKMADEQPTDIRPSLKQAIRDWIGKNPEISGVSGLAAALGEPTESFRVRLSRNRWSRRILKRLVDTTGLADSIEDLQAKFELEVSERTVRSAARPHLGSGDRFDLMTEDEPAAKPVLVKAKLSDKEQHYVAACKMSQNPIPDEFDRLTETDQSTLILVWNLPDDLQKSTLKHASLHAKLFDQTFCDFVSNALKKGTHADFHFLIECENGSNADSSIMKLLSDSFEAFLKKVKSDDTSKKMLTWTVHFFTPGVLIDVYDLLWIHVIPPVDQVGWALFDNENLRSRLQKIRNPWPYTTLAAPISKESIGRTLCRLGYKIDFSRAWTFTPTEELRQFDLARGPESPNVPVPKQ
ncbi:MAG TPA: hypothetical protein VLG69_03960 [Candidatus Andersenbacteria bacterium]|nr:hypothetical protein [Candidatus Andersenbacteria bacterium]